MRKQSFAIVLAATLAAFGGTTAATALVPAGSARIVLSETVRSDVQQVRHRHRRHWGHHGHRRWGHHHRRSWRHRHRRHGYYGFVPRFYGWGGGHHHHHRHGHH